MSACQVNWRAFGLEPPETERCQEQAAFWIRQMCVHEHLQQAPICIRHLEIMRSYLSLDQYDCGRCAHHVSESHQCLAPVKVDAFPGMEIVKEKEAQR